MINVTLFSCINHLDFQPNCFSTYYNAIGFQNKLALSNYPKQHFSINILD